MNCPGCGVNLLAWAGDHVVSTLGALPVVFCPELPDQVQLVIPETGETMALVVEPRRVMSRHPAPTPTRIEVVREGRWT